MSMARLPASEARSSPQVCVRRDRLKNLEVRFHVVIQFFCYASRALRALANTCSPVAISFIEYVPAAISLSPKISA